MVGGPGVQSPVCLPGSEGPLRVDRPEAGPGVTEEDRESGLGRENIKLEPSPGYRWKGAGPRHGGFSFLNNFC